MLWLLAQSDTAEKASHLLLYSCVVIVAVLLFGWIVIAVARKRAREIHENVKPMLPFTLHDLREMHRAGQLSDEEFQKARDKIVAMSKAALARSEKKPGLDLKKRLRQATPEPPAPGAENSGLDTPGTGDFERPPE